MVKITVCFFSFSMRNHFMVSMKDIWKASVTRTILKNVPCHVFFYLVLSSLLLLPVQQDYVWIILPCGWHVCIFLSTGSFQRRGEIQRWTELKRDACFHCSHANRARTTVAVLSGSPVTPMWLVAIRNCANIDEVYNLHWVRLYGRKKYVDPVHPICMPSCVWVFLHARLPVFDGALWDVIREWGLLSQKPSWNSQTGTQPHLTLLTLGLQAFFLSKQIKRAEKNLSCGGKKMCPQSRDTVLGFAF